MARAGQATAGPEPYRQALLDALDAVKSPGDFSTAGQLGLAVLPHLQTESVGTLKLPLSLDATLALKQQCQQAPFGRGSATVVDTTVRNTLQLSPEQFSIANENDWSKELDALLDEVKEGLGLPEDADVEAQLYKLLLYEPGSFFLPHKDSEKAPGMFGTLSIMLPSTFTGGELVLRHGGRTHTYGSAQLEADAGDRAAYVAFYADVEHEVKPLIDGYRLVLTYNLVQTGRTNRLPQTVSNPLFDDLAAAVSAWEANENGPIKLLYMLEHQYTEAGLKGLESLKNGDYARGLLLRAVAQQTGLNVAVAQVEFHQVGEADESAFYERDRYCDRFGRRHRCWYDDEDEDESEEEPPEPEPTTFYMTDVIEEELLTKGWVPLEGGICMGKGEVEVDMDQVLQKDFFGDAEPDREECNGPTGNEGCPMDRWYDHAAFIMWPKKHHHEVLAGNLGVSWLLTQLQGKVNALQRLQALQLQSCADAGHGQQQAEGSGACAVAASNAAAGSAGVAAARAEVVDLAQGIMRIGAMPKPEQRMMWSSNFMNVPRSSGGSGMNASVAAGLLRVLLQLGDTQLLNSFLSTGPVTNSNIDINAMADALLECCAQLGWAHMGPVMVRLAKQRLALDGGRSYGYGCTHQLQVLKLLCSMAGMQLSLAPGSAAAQQQACAARPVCAEQQAACLGIAQALVGAALASHSGGSCCSGDTGVQLMACLMVMAGTGDLLERCATYMLRSPISNEASFNALLQPTVQLGAWLGPAMAASCGPFMRMFKACADWLAPLVRSPPDPAEKLAINEALRCRCMHCVSFERFLRSSTQRTWRMEGLQRDCRHISGQGYNVVRGTLVFDHSRGKKFVLTVTKTDAALKARQAKYQQDCAVAAKLAALLPPVSSNAIAAVTRAGSTPQEPSANATASARVPAGPVAADRPGGAFRVAASGAHAGAGRADAGMQPARLGAGAALQGAQVTAVVTNATGMMAGGHAAVVVSGVTVQAGAAAGMGAKRKRPMGGAAGGSGMDAQRHRDQVEVVDLT